MKKGVIKVSMYYPFSLGKKFDFDYYVNKHIPAVGALSGDTLKNFTVDKGLAGIEAGSPAPFLATYEMYFENIEGFQKFYNQAGEKLMEDIPHFTNIEPVIQISEVLI